MTRSVPGKFAISSLLLFLFLPFHSPGQELKFRHITPRDGLSSQFVKDIIRDSTGFMWFATATGGLCRYDGYLFKTYRYIPGDSTSLSSDHVNCILETRRNKFLLGTYSGGMNWFDANTEQFIAYRHDPDDPSSISSDRVNVIYRDREGTIWVGTQHGLDIFDPATNQFTSFIQCPEIPDHPSDAINALYDDSEGIFWVGTNSGLFHFDRRNFSFKKIDLCDKENGSNNEIINCIYEIHDGSIWIGTMNWLFVLHDGKVNHISPQTDRSKYPSNKNVTGIIEFKMKEDFDLWITTQWGLNKYDFSSKQFQRFYPEKAKPESLMTGDLRKIFYDQSGLIWIAAADHGIEILRLNFTPVIQVREIVGNNFIHSACCFYQDSKSNVWVGSHGACLLKYDQDIHFIKRYLPLFPDDTSHYNARIEDILEDPQQRLIVSMHIPRPGVYHFTEKSGIFHPVPLDTLPGQIIPDRIRDMLMDEDGVIWVGTSSGLFYIKPGNELKGQPYHIGRQVFTRIWDLMLDQHGDLWVASEDGLFEITGKKSEHPELVHYDFYSEIKNATGQYPRYLLECREGTIWVGASRGLCRTDLHERIFYPVDMSDEWINNNMIVSLVEDKQGRLWMNSSRGLIRYDPALKNGKGSRLYDVSDGLPYDGYISTPLYQNQDGWIFVPANYGTQNGFYFFNPHSVSVNEQLPNIVITDFKVRNEDYQSDSSISVMNHLTLDYNQDFFTIDFAALDFTDPAKNRFAYYLEGFEDDWVYSGDHHFAIYTGVPPGSYVFRVIGSNNDGIWNEAGASLAITVLPPPWKTWWAVTLYILVTAAILVSIVWYYLKRQQLKQQLALEQLSKEKLEELDTMKSRFFANISHEFRTPLTLILGPLQKLIPEEKDDRKKQELTIMRRNAKHLHRLINQLLDLTKLESGKMKLQCAGHDLVPLIRNYIQSFESLAKQKNIGLSFQSDRDSILCWVDRIKMETVMNNLLSNAFKFTPEGGRIDVKVASSQSAVASQRDDHDKKPTTGYRLLATEGSYVEITVSDTGTGIPPENLPHIFDRFYQAGDDYTKNGEGTGIGLALTKELVELHGGTITVESVVNHGSTFRVYLPVGKELLRGERRKERGERRDKGIEQEEMIGVLTRNPERETLNAEPVLLIVEDNPDMRYYIRGYFEMDFHVLEVGDGKEGLRLAREHLPDIIVSDVMMPEMNGIEFCRKIKSGELTSHIPVILLTARASRESRLEGLETGADDFITKPFDGEELIIRVNNLITQRIRLKEKFRKEFEQSKDIPGAIRLSMDERFLQKAISVIEKHLSDPDFSVQQFAEEMALSRVQLHRKLTAIVNRNATDFIRIYRLNKAAGMIQQRTGTMAEIAYDAGFSSPSYFTECFKKQYGVSPTEYQEQG